MIQGFETGLTHEGQYPTDACNTSPNSCGNATHEHSIAAKLHNVQQQHGIDVAARLDWTRAANYQASPTRLLNGFLLFTRCTNAAACCMGRSLQAQQGNAVNQQVNKCALQGTSGIHMAVHPAGFRFKLQRIDTSYPDLPG